MVKAGKLSCFHLLGTHVPSVIAGMVKNRRVLSFMVCAFGLRWSTELTKDYTG